MRIRRLGPGRERAWIGDYLAATSGLTLHTDGTERWLVVHTRDGAAYAVERCAVSGDRAFAIDRTEFEVGADRFAEVARTTARFGPNLHPRPIALPAELVAGDWHHPLHSSSRVCLLYAGPVRAGAHEIDAIALVAEEGAARRVQWLARGVGELALGPLGGPVERWLIGGSGWPDPIPPELAALPREPLPDRSADQPVARLL